MPIEATSQSLRAASELTLIAEIKPGFVPASETLSYATRLRHALKMFFALRKATQEREANPDEPAGALEKLRMIKFLHWTVIDDDRRMLLTVSFDGPWEPYIRRIVDVAGPFLDTIFCNCTGYENSSSDLGYRNFARWIRERQVPCDLIYASNPELTTDDVRYLSAFEKLHATQTGAGTFEAPAVQLTVGDPQSKPDGGKYFRLLSALWRLIDEFAGDKSDLTFYERAAWLLSRELEPAGIDQLPAAPPAVLPSVFEWAQHLRNTFRPQPPAAPQTVALDARAVQGNILTGYEGMTHGCMAFVQFDSPKSGAAFLSRVKGSITAEGADADEGAAVDRGYPRVNLALTYRGLQTLGIDPALLADLPKEFRQGLTARAPMLGMIGPSHPSNWSLPRTNWPDGQDGDGRDRDGQPIPLETIDAVVILQTRPDQARPDQARPDKDGPDNDFAWTKDHPLYDRVNGLTDQPGARILGVQPLRRWFDKNRVREHFGFVDGVSQPIPRTTAVTLPPESRDAVALGELLLGHPDERGETVSFEGDPGLFKNGSFLVVTKIEQKVDAFNKYVNSVSPKDSDQFKAKLLGRTLEGKALIPTPEGSDNAFDYSKDSNGQQCPFHAHVRRANPRRDGEATDGRVLQAPRIMRRGFSYGPKRGTESAAERGIVFMAYNASIADQFEVIQSWINGGNSTGILSSRADLIAGATSWPAAAQVRSDGAAPFRAPGEPFVRVHWGMYLFVPSIEAIATMARGLPAATGAAAPATIQVSATRPPVSAVEAHLIEEGNRIIKKLEHAGPEQWKRLLEEIDSRPAATAIWAAIRAGGGVLKTPFGVLVGSAETVKKVLSNEVLFSAREYWDRMRKSFGETFLGMDRLATHSQRPDRSQRDRDYESKVGAGHYNREADIPNEYINSISVRDGFLAAREGTEEYLANLTAALRRGAPGAAQPGAAPQPQSQPQPLTIEIKRLACSVVGKLAFYWFGTPDPTVMTVDGTARNDEHARCPVDFLKASQFIFLPNPGPATKEIGETRGGVLHTAAQDFIAAKPTGAFLDYLRKRNYCGGDEDALARTWTGTISGFVVPTIGSFLSAMMQWTKSRELWRLQQWLLALPRGPEDLGAKLLDGQPEDEEIKGSPLAHSLISAMVRAPIADLLHREALCDLDIISVPGEDGQPERVVRVNAGDRVVVSLGSAAADAPSDPEFLFGGRDTPDAPPTHACPGRKMATGVMVGMAVALLKLKNLSDPDLGPLMLSFT